jgi:hypothetical protein
MKKSVVSGCGIMLAALVIGCGSSGPDATVKEMISVMNEEASLLESKADKAKVDAVKARAEALKKKMDGFSKEQLASAMEKNKDEYLKAGARLMKASLGGIFDKFKMPDLKDFKMPMP